MDDRYESLVRVGLIDWLTSLFSTLTGADALTKLELATQRERHALFEQLLSQIDANVTRRMALSMVTTEPCVQLLRACYQKENVTTPQLIELGVGLFILMDQKPPGDQENIYDFLKKIQILARERYWSHKVAKPLRQCEDNSSLSTVFENWQSRLESVARTAFDRYGAGYLTERPSPFSTQEPLSSHQEPMGAQALDLCISYVQVNRPIGQRFFEAYRAILSQREQFLKEVIQQSVFAALKYGPNILSLFFRRFRHRFQQDCYLLANGTYESSPAITQHSETLLTWIIQQTVESSRVAKIMMIFDSEGLNFNRINNLIDRNTALHVAILKEKFELVACLVQYGADIAFLNAAGDIPLSLLVQKTSKCFEYIVQHPATHSLLYEAFACLINESTVRKTNISPLVESWIARQPLCLQFIAYSCSYIKLPGDELPVHSNEHERSNEVLLNWFTCVLALFAQAGATIAFSEDGQRGDLQVLCLLQGFSSKQILVWENFLSQFGFYEPVAQQGNLVRPH